MREARDSRDEQAQSLPVSLVPPISPVSHEASVGKIPPCYSPEPDLGSPPESLRQSGVAVVVIITKR
jgi:hypothetical protein